MNHTCQLLWVILCFIAAMNANPQNIAPKQIASNEDSFSIDSLTSRIGSLSHSADWWNNGYLLFVTLSVIVAGMTVYFQYTAVNKARRLADTQEQLSRVKEQQLAGDLKDKDVKIAESNARASEADARAREAEAQVASAKAASDAASAKAESFRLDIAKANERAAEANRLAESERLERRRIEERLAPRSITLDEQKELTAKLSLLGAQKVDLFQYPNDPEIAGIAQQVSNSLEMAGWSVVPIQPLSGSVSGMLVEFDPRDNTARARAESLVSALAALRLTVQGPIPSLPTPTNRLPVYMSGDKGGVGASLRLTVGKK